MCDVLERWGEYLVEWNARRGFHDPSKYVAVSRKHYRTQKPPMHLSPALPLLPPPPSRYSYTPIIPTPKRSTSPTVPPIQTPTPIYTSCNPLLHNPHPPFESQKSTVFLIGLLKYIYLVFRESRLDWTGLDWTRLTKTCCRTISSVSHKFGFRALCRFSRGGRTEISGVG